ncbi:complex I subunit 4 family protein [Rhabdothermincola sediminis]|uniref:complex I subunit 4 family protein n=1 Tax=Rhabdothermincola sediminis TaxID=2751370 RepID=UPI001AA00E04|nr:NADH-quinone oxidoreductase subunit M [Rhabdothermincola sediminis]
MAAHAASGFPVLPAMVLLPVFGTILIVCTPRSRPDLHRLTSILTAVAVAAISIWVLVEFRADDPGFQFVSSQTWIEALDIKFILGVDGISLFLVVLTAVLFPIALFAAKPDHDEKGYYLWITLLEAGCMGVFLALDLFLFFLMFELTIVPLYFLIGRWGHGRRVYAATKFFLFTMLGSAFMLVAIVALAVLAKAGETGGVSFDLQRLVGAVQNEGVARDTARWIFLGFVVAFAIKTPVFPFHTWLPDAHTEAPTAGSVDLAGVLLKLGTYGFMRYGLYLFPEASVWFAPVMLTLGTIGIVYGGIVAAMQRNLKRLVAYSSVAHMGFAIVGLFALNTEGLLGSVMVMVNHGIITGALFILLGWIYKRRHTYEISAFRGWQKVAPWFAGAFSLTMLASIGLPGLNGFVGEFLVLLGTFVAHRWWAVVAASGVIFAALYMLWAYQRAFHGEPDEENRSFPEMVLSEKLVILPLIGLMVFIGVYPKPMLERIQPSVERLIAHVEASTGDFREPVTQAGAELDPARIEERMREAEGDHTTGEGTPVGVGETTGAGSGREEGGR